MRWYIEGKIGQQMEDFVRDEYAENDVEILELAKAEGIPAFKELIRENEDAVRKILDDEDRGLNEICDLKQYAEILVRNYQDLRILENTIKSRKKFLKKNK